MGQGAQSPRPGMGLQSGGDQRLIERGRQLPAHAGGRVAFALVDDELHHGGGQQWQVQGPAEAALVPAGPVAQCGAVAALGVGAGRRCTKRAPGHASGHAAGRASSRFNTPPNARNCTRTCARPRTARWPKWIARAKPCSNCSTAAPPRPASIKASWRPCFKPACRPSTPLPTPNVNWVSRPQWPARMRASLSAWGACPSKCGPHRTPRAPARRGAIEARRQRQNVASEPIAPRARLAAHSPAAAKARRVKNTLRRTTTYTPAEIRLRSADRHAPPHVVAPTEGDEWCDQRWRVPPGPRAITKE